MDVYCSVSSLFVMLIVLRPKREYLSESVTWVVCRKVVRYLYAVRLRGIVDR